MTLAGDGRVISVDALGNQQNVTLSESARVLVPGNAKVPGSHERVSNTTASMPTVACGTNGFVALRDPRQRQFRTLPAMIPPRGTVLPAFYCGTVIDQETWLAGAPGNHIAVLRESGSIRWVSTPTRSALHSLCASDGNIWAVGDAGTILHSKDGGESWKVQRGEGHRTGILVVAKDFQSVPWMVVNRYSLGEGIRCSIATTRSREMPTPFSARLMQQQVASQLGLIADHRFDLAESEGEAVGAAQRILESAAPHCVVLDDGLPLHLQNAFIAAAKSLGIPRVVQANRGSLNRTSLSDLAMLPRIAALQHDVTSDVLAITNPGLPNEARVAMRLLYQSPILAHSPSADDLVRGIAVGGAFRDQWSGEPSRQRLQMLRARARQITLLKRLFLPEVTAQDFQRHLQLLWEQSGPQSRVRLFRDLLSTAVNERRMDHYEAILDFGLRHHAADGAAAIYGAAPDASQHAAAWDAIRCSLSRMQLSMSAGREWQYASQQEIPGLAASPVGKESAASVRPVSAVQVSPFQTETDLQQSNHVTNTIGDFSKIQSPKTNHALNPRHTPASAGSAEDPGGTTSLASLGKALDFAHDLMNPGVLAIQSLEHNQNLAAAASSNQTPTQGDHFSLQEPQSKRVANGNATEKDSVLSLDSIARSAIRQPGMRAWIPWMAHIDEGHRSRVRRVACVTRPMLDGSLEDACWHSALPFRRDGVEARINADSQFLYIALSSEILRSNQTQDESTDGMLTAVRRRDMPIDDEHRIQVRIDIDGDLGSYFSLEIDCEGNTHDGVCGFSAWQPRMYVKTRLVPGSREQPGGRFITELAIHRSDCGLENHSLASISVERIQPNRTSGPNRATLPSDWQCVRLP